MKAARKDRIMRKLQRHSTWVHANRIVRKIRHLQNRRAMLSQSNAIYFAEGRAEFKRLTASWARLCNAHALAFTFTNWGGS